MKITFNTLPLLVIIVYGLTVNSCKKEYVPTLTTSATTNMTGTTATSGGTITDEGSGTVISRGVCWSTGTSPTISDNKTSDGAGAGTFTSNITGLNGETTYYVRAYATNSVGTGYGTVISFTTPVEFPSLKVVNQNTDSRIITAVSLVGYEFNNLSISVGGSQTFTLDKGMSGGYNDINIKVSYSNGGYLVASVSKLVNFTKGETTPITFKGCISFEGCNGFYLE